VFVDEPRADSNTGIRMASWSPVGVTHVPYTLYNRDKQRDNILPTCLIAKSSRASLYTQSRWKRLTSTLTSIWNCYLIATWSTLLVGNEGLIEIVWSHKVTKIRPRSTLTNTEDYNYWIKYFLLPCCNPYPALKSVIVIDKPSFYYLPRIAALFKRAGVKLVYLPAYSPDSII